MKLKSDKKNKIPYSVTITTQFVVCMTQEEEDDGTEIPEKIIKKAVLENIESGNYEVQEDLVE